MRSRSIVLVSVVSAIAATVLVVVLAQAAVPAFASGVVRLAT